MLAVSISTGALLSLVNGNILYSEAAEIMVTMQCMKGSSCSIQWQSWKYIIQTNFQQSSFHLHILSKWNFILLYKFYPIFVGVTKKKWNAAYSSNIIWQWKNIKQNFTELIIFLWKLMWMKCLCKKYNFQEAKQVKHTHRLHSFIE